MNAEPHAVSVDAPMQGRAGIVQALRELLAAEIRRRETAEAQAKRLGAWGWTLQNQLDEANRQNRELREELIRYGLLKS